MKTSKTYRIYTDSGSGEYESTTLAKALVKWDEAPKWVKTAEDFEKWLTKIGGFGGIQENGLQIANVRPWNTPQQSKPQPTPNQMNIQTEIKTERINMKFNRITCFVPALSFACDCPQLREKVSELPGGVKLDDDGVSEAQCVNVNGGEVSVWYEEAKW
jgi:hypothetical protein